LDRLGIDTVTVRGRRAIAVMAAAAAALVLSGVAFVHAGAKPSRLAPASSQVAASGRVAPGNPYSGITANRSQPVTLSEAEAEARQAGLALMRPRWLPFRSSPSDGPRQVQELRDSTGGLFGIVTVYYGPDGQMLAIMQEFQPAQLSLADLEGTVRSSPAPWSAPGGGLSLAWKVSGGRYVIVQAMGMTEDELQRVAASLATA
jgi:hypothetical protein